MTATIIPFPAPSLRTPENAGEDSITKFLRGLDESRSLNQEFRLSGPEWLEVLDLMREGLSKRDAAKVVVAKRTAK